jgi:hypothetical protein
MILTHGGNSISRDDGNYILDNFVALYNGVTDSGYTINDGSFGQLLRDTNGPIVAPDGLGMPYYARANFSGNNGGVQAIYDGLKSVFSSDFTVELWVLVDTNAALDNQNICGGYDSNLNASAFTIANPTWSRSTFQLTFANSYGVANPGIASNTWYHIAITANNTDYRIFLNGTQIKYEHGLSPRTDTNTIRFRFTGNAGGIRIAQFALRNYAVWTENFTPPTLLYKQI